MTQLMEGANSNRPVPATDEIMEKLPREVLEEGSQCIASARADHMIDIPF